MHPLPAHSALLAVRGSAFAVVRCVVRARTAAAQDQAVIDKLVQMNKKALDDYDTLDWDAAKRTLLDALVTGKRAGLENHPVMARTYVHLGACTSRASRIARRGCRASRAPWRSIRRSSCRRGSRRPRSRRRSPRRSADARRRRRVAPPPAAAGGDERRRPRQQKRRGPVMEGDAPPDAHPKPKKHHGDGDEEPDLPAHINALDCPSPTRPSLDKPLTLRCAVAPNLPVASVFLLYRAPDKQTTTRSSMTKSPKGWLQAKIPKKAVTGKSVQFYFEGRNAAGKPVVANGGADSPNIVLIVEEEAEGARRRPRRSAKRTRTRWRRTRGPAAAHPPRARRQGARGARHPVRQAPVLDRDRHRHRLRLRQGERLRGGQQVASPGPLPFASDPVHPGLAWAGIGQLEPEIGYAFNPGLALSVAGRLQYTAPTAKYADFTYKGAIGVMAKLLFYTKQSQLRFFFGPLVGGGNFRFLGYPDAGTTTATPTSRTPSRRDRSWLARPAASTTRRPSRPRWSSRSTRSPACRPSVWSPTSTSRCSSIFTRRPTAQARRRARRGRIKKSQNSLR